VTHDTTRAERPPTAVVVTSTSTLSWRWPLIAVTLVYSFIVGGLRTFTPASNVAIFGTGAIFLAIALFRPPKRVPPPRSLERRGIMAWTIMLGVFSVQEIANDLLGSSYAHPTLSILMTPILDHQLFRAVAVFVWIAVGVELLRR